ncbi:hypothetical protein BS78_04G000900 [Paspalum vaginatum]|nr:hypothetical protein BS78_04G000900 [Paspalum vaginatum]
MIRRRCSTEAADVGGRRHCSATNLPAIMGDGDALCGDRVDLPIIQHDDDDGGGGGETEDGSSSSCAKKLENKPPSVTSCLLPTRSLRSTAAAAAAQPQIITPHQTSCSQQADGGGIRSLSFSKILSFRLPSWGWGAPMSSSTLELDYYIDQLDNHDTAAAAAADKEEEEEELKQVCRSQSVPTSVRRFNGAGSRSSGRMRRVADYSSSLLGPGGLAVRLRVVPLAPPPTHQGKQQEAAAAEQQQDEQEDIAAEEAVCRICMVALSEEEVLKLECCCKGELALAHRACAIKWFSIKGNGTCDVCNQEVRNLPVTLRRLHGHPTAVQAAVALVQAQEDDAADAQHQHQAAASAGLDTTSHRRRFRVWHGTPILVIISMLAYFCFLEQLLVGDHGTVALAISLPFACVLGLFSSLTTAKMVSRRYVWIYSAVQFLFIVLFTHLFYRYVGMQAVIAIILSTFAGFSVTICTNSVLLQILRWRARHVVALQTANTTGDLSSREPPVPDLEIALPPL